MPTHAAGPGAPNEIRLTRVYDASAKEIWDAWNDVEQVVRWWGPRGFTLTSHSKDLRPGGRWKYTMHGPGGKDFPNLTSYLEVVPYTKMVYDHGGTESSPPMFRVTVLFSEQGGKTTMDMTMALPTAEAAEKTRAYIKQAGGDACWDRLAEYLEKESSGREVFVIARTFDAPPDALYDLWTDPERLALWVPPKGATMEYLRADIRPGGSAFYRMPHPGGLMHGRAEYLELSRPRRLVYVQSFCDADGRPSRHPMAPQFPQAMRTEVTLSPEGPRATRVVVRWTPVDGTPADEAAFFAGMRASMTQGWTGSFDKLDALIAGREP